MAKRKTPKARPSNKTITKEELEKVQALVSQLRNLQFEVGAMESKKHSVLHKIVQTQSEFAAFNVELETTYGEVDIDINTGEIKEKENVKIDS
tara:strand:+ start:815 stop:1093 length:279 start_codon:yes stop_codon:yes gene_type:complete